MNHGIRNYGLFSSQRSTCSELISLERHLSLATPVDPLTLLASEHDWAVGTRLAYDTQCRGQQDLDKNTTVRLPASARVPSIPSRMLLWGCPVGGVRMIPRLNSAANCPQRTDRGKVLGRGACTEYCEDKFGPDRRRSGHWPYAGTAQKSASGCLLEKLCGPAKWIGAGFRFAVPVPYVVSSSLF